MRIPKRFTNKFVNEFRTDLGMAAKEGFAFDGHWIMDDYTVHWTVEVLPKGREGFDPVWADEREYQAYAEDEDGPVGK